MNISQVINLWILAYYMVYVIAIFLLLYLFYVMGKEAKRLDEEKKKRNGTYHTTAAEKFSIK